MFKIHPCIIKNIIRSACITAHFRFTYCRKNTACLPPTLQNGQCLYCSFLAGELRPNATGEIRCTRVVISHRWRHFDGTNPKRGNYHRVDIPTPVSVKIAFDYVPLLRAALYEFIMKVFSSLAGTVKYVFRVRFSLSSRRTPQTERGECSRRKEYTNASCL